MKHNDLRRRMTALITAVLLLAGAMTGCGKDDETEQVTLRTMSVLGYDGARDIYTGLLRDYSLEYPHVYHIGTLAESENAYKLDATFESTYTSSSYPHAVCYYIDSGIMELKDQFVSLEEIRAKYPDFASGVTDAALDSVRAYDGKVYCLPFAGSWTALAVNTDLMAAYSLKTPETWQELIVAAGVLSARGITAIANSPDDSAALLELMCLSAAGEKTLDSALSEDAPLAGEGYRNEWLTVFRHYEELCGINSFPLPAQTEEIALALELMNPSGAVSGSDASTLDAGTDNAVGPIAAEDSLELFNSGKAAMMIVDSEDYESITLENFRLALFPDCTQKTNGVVAGGYDVGWFITRRAFSDNSVRDAVVAFVDTMISGKASESFALLGALPSVTSDGDVSSGLYGVAANAGEFARSRRTPANSARFEALEQIAAALSLDMITPEQAVRLAANPDLRLTDVVERPTPPAPEPTVSDSDI